MLAQSEPVAVVVDAIDVVVEVVEGDGDVVDDDADGVLADYEFGKGSDRLLAVINLGGPCMSFVEDFACEVAGVDVVVGALVFDVVAFVDVDLVRCLVTSSIVGESFVDAYFGYLSSR